MHSLNVAQGGGKVAQCAGEARLGKALPKERVFVFDERVSVADDLGICNYRLCTQCSWPRPHEPQAGCPACGR